MSKVELKDGMSVIAPKGCGIYVTAGKEYEVFNVEKTSKGRYYFNIIDDTNDQAICLLNRCTYLNHKNWIIKQ